jgi:hypothetical protein
LQDACIVPLLLTLFSALQEQLPRALPGRAVIQSQELLFLPPFSSVRACVPASEPLLQCLFLLPRERRLQPLQLSFSRAPRVLSFPWAAQ